MSNDPLHPHPPQPDMTMLTYLIGCSLKKSTNGPLQIAVETDDSNLYFSSSLICVSTSWCCSRQSSLKTNVSAEKFPCVHQLSKNFMKWQSGRLIKIILDICYSFWRLYQFPVSSRRPRTIYSTGNWYNLQKSIEYTMYIIKMSYTLYYSCKE